MIDIIRFKKNKKGDLLVSLQLGELFSLPATIVKQLFSLLFNFIEYIFVSLDSVTRSHTLVALVAALGLGIGMSITIFGRPSIGLASPVDMVVSPQSDLMVDYLVFDQISRVVSVSEDQGFGKNNDHAWQVTTSTNNLVLAGYDNNQVFGGIDSLSLGSNLTVVMDNNGRYKYVLVQIKKTDIDGVQTIISTESDALIMYKKVGLLRDEVIVLIAKKSTR